MITTLLLLHSIRYLGVYTFCTTVYYMLVAREPHFCITMYYMLVAQEPQFCIMTLCITTFWMYIKSFMVIGLFIYMCKNCVCDEFIVYETNANLTRS